MRCHCGLVNGFFKYLKDRKDITKIAIVMALGLVLIFMGLRGTDEEKVESIGLEERIAAACSAVDGVGECSVYVYYAPKESRNDEAKVESVIVICEGAESVEVRLRLTELLSSFFGIGTNRIRIEKMSE